MAGKNRIVVDYGDYEGLVLLGAFNTKIGNEITRTELDGLESFELVKKYDGLSNYNELKGLIANDAEGFVVRFNNGSRMKIKSEEYVRLHKIMTNISTTGVWNILANGEAMSDILFNVPDEFYDKIKKYENELLSMFSILETEYKWIFNKIFIPDMRINKDLRRNFAMFANEFKHPSILFSMLDGKDHIPIIWNKLKPKYKKL